ncbi:MAG: ComEA family DNA-binding protein [Desulfotomaculaceae bacterium]|nr:ComEA family DNA-binding protein [Desulfotomaculaceae bacterium]MDD4767406.1 ComEA family DNA-binding protein [Desulfotomaculaceae bacterium]
MIQIEKRQQLILLILVGIILFGGGYRLAQVQKGPAVEPALERPAPEQASVKNFSVHVIGAVTNPGVYRLPADQRIVDAVSLAGPLAEADLDALKLAAKIVDGQDIYVPFQGEQSGPAPAGGQPAAPDRAGGGVFSAGAGAGTAGLLNINTADQAQLDTLPGIGSALAQRIIQYRETNGPFQAIEDLKDVSGIGDKNFENMKDRITVY